MNSLNEALQFSYGVLFHKKKREKKYQKSN